MFFWSTSAQSTFQYRRGPGSVQRPVFGLRQPAKCGHCTSEVRQDPRISLTMTLASNNGNLDGMRFRNDQGTTEKRGPRCHAIGDLVSICERLILYMYRSPDWRGILPKLPASRSYN